MATQATLRLNEDEDAFEMIDPDGEHWGVYDRDEAESAAVIDGRFLCSFAAENGLKANTVYRLEEVATVFETTEFEEDEDEDDIEEEDDELVVEDEEEE